MPNFNQLLDAFTEWKYDPAKNCFYRFHKFAHNHRIEISVSMMNKLKAAHKFRCSYRHENTGLDLIYLGRTCRKFNGRKF